MLIASTIASAAWGSGIASSAIIRDLAREHGGTPEASVWFDPGPKLPVAEAARVNAVMTLRPPMTATCGISSMPAPRWSPPRSPWRSAQAPAARTCWPPSSWATRSGRIGEAVTPGLRTRGFHGCLVSIFAGAVATGRLLGLDPSRMAQAIALSATSIGGLMAAANTSVAREYHAGLAAMLGVHAALAAQKGYGGREHPRNTPWLL